MTADPRGSLSPLDDYPVHQTAEPMRRVATSDRNFYDRYYFNCYPSDDADLFLVVGLGQYPNLGVCDGFAVLRRGNDHIVVRASKALGTDRTDTAVGPLRVEVLEGLQRLRVVLEAGHPETADLSFDLTFEGDVPATEEDPQKLRQLERVVMDTSRFVQSGTWSGASPSTGTAARSIRRSGGATATDRGVCGRSARPNHPAARPPTAHPDSSGSTR